MNEQNNGAAEPEVFPLDDAGIEVIAEIEARIQPLIAQENAVLSYFLRQHKLAGMWTLQREGSGAFRELVKAPAPAPARP